MGTVPLLGDEEASPEARAVLGDIRAKRGAEPSGVNSMRKPPSVKQPRRPLANYRSR